METQQLVKTPVSLCRRIAVHSQDVEDKCVVAESGGRRPRGGTAAAHQKRKNRACQDFLLLGKRHNDEIPCIKLIRRRCIRGPHTLAQLADNPSDRSAVSARGRETGVFDGVGSVLKILQMGQVEIAACLTDRHRQLVEFIGTVRLGMFLQLRAER